MKSRIFLFIAMVAMVVCQPMDPVEKQINDLLSQMTLEEKVAQMTQVCGGKISEDIADQIRNGAGTMLNSVGAEADYYQRIAVEESRLGIPMIFARDVIHGFRTIFPIPLGQAATFDPDIVEEGARIAAEEAIQAGLRWTFSPMVDVARDPRWGRVAEGYGEDTYLASVMGAAAVRGYQGNDSVVRMAACVKHFAGYAASEGGRDYNSTWIPEIQLRETYLPPFKAAIDAGSLSIMCAFNDLNGVPASANKHLNVDILRDEWQFDGVLVSDWASLQNMNNQGNSANLKEATKLCMDAQMDIDMESKGYPRHLKELVEEGKVSMDVIDNCVRNILRMKFRLGLFDNPYCYTENPEYFTAEALAAAQKAAEESAVLLTNNGILPLNNNPKFKIQNSKLTVLVCGPMANAPHEQNGTWCFDKDDAMTITPMMAFRDLAKQGKIRLIEQKGEHWSREFNKENIATLVRLAKQADVVLYFAGEESILSGEARSRAVLNLPGDQSEQIKAIKATGKPIVLTVMAGRPLCIREDIDRADAVLYAFHGGTMQGPALANLIMGKVAPSGRLPMTFPMGEGQIPFYYNYKTPSRKMAKSPKLINDIPIRAYQFSVGESSYWLEYGNKPEYPFGYGLTYTTFEYGPVVLSDTSLVGSSSSYLTVSCEIRNTGQCEAVAVPQLYIRDVVGTLTRPIRELKGFQRVSIPAGESRTVGFQISEKDLAYWHMAEGASLGSEGEYTFSAEAGEFHIWIAANAAEGEHATFTLKY